MENLDAIRGMLLPLPTVFDGEGEVDEPVQRDLVQFYLDRGVHALFVLGSYGQGPAMRTDQRQRVLALVLEEVRGRVPVVAHIGSIDPYTAIDLGRHARAVGADAVAMVGPYYYNDRTTDELALHFQRVDQAVQLPLFLYNNPGYQGYPITPAVFQRLLQAAPSIFGIKLALGTLDEALSFLAVRSDLAVFATAGVLVPGMRQGIRGTVSPPLSLAPELGVALIHAIDEGRDDEAAALQRQVNEMSEVVNGLWKRYGRAVHAEGLRALGLPVKEFPRWPTVSLPEADRAALLAALSSARPVAPAR